MYVMTKLNEYHKLLSEDENPSNFILSWNNVKFFLMESTSNFLNDYPLLKLLIFNYH